MEYTGWCGDQFHLLLGRLGLLFVLCLVERIQFLNRLARTEIVNRIRAIGKVVTVLLHRHVALHGTNVHNAVFFGGDEISGDRSLAPSVTPSMEPGMPGFIAYTPIMPGALRALCPVRRGVITGIRPYARDQKH